MQENIPPYLIHKLQFFRLPSNLMSIKTKKYLWSSKIQPKILENMV